MRHQHFTRKEEGKKREIIFSLSHTFRVVIIDILVEEEKKTLYLQSCDCFRFFRLEIRQKKILFSSHWSNVKHLTVLNWTSSTKSVMILEEEKKTINHFSTTHINCIFNDDYCFLLFLFRTLKKTHTHTQEFLFVQMNNIQLNIKKMFFSFFETKQKSTSTVRIKRRRTYIDLLDLSKPKERNRIR